MKPSVAPFVLAAILVPTLALAGPAEDKGLEIAKEADRRDTGFANTTADMVMILRNKRGQETKEENTSTTFHDLSSPADSCGAKGVQSGPSMGAA